MELEVYPTFSCPISCKESCKCLYRWLLFSIEWGKDRDVPKSMTGLQQNLKLNGNF